MTITWRKSSYSSNNDACVELAAVSEAVLVRDSKHPEGGHLTLGRPELAALIAATAAGEFDHLA